MENENILEVVEFKLKKNIEKEDFLKAAYNMMNDLREQSGFLKRELLKEEENWVDIVHWDSLRHAKLAEKKILTLSKSLEFFNMIDKNTIKMNHFKKVREYKN
jgi:hypothetical protein